LEHHRRRLPVSHPRAPRRSRRKNHMLCLFVVTLLLCCWIVLRMSSSSSALMQRSRWEAERLAGWSLRHQRAGPSGSWHIAMPGCPAVRACLSMLLRPTSGSPGLYPVGGRSRYSGMKMSDELLVASWWSARTRCWAQHQEPDLSTVGCSTVVAGWALETPWEIDRCGPF
jgi:hypothetical protein